MTMASDDIGELPLHLREVAHDGEQRDSRRREVEQLNAGVVERRGDRVAQRGLAGPRGTGDHAVERAAAELSVDENFYVTVSQGT